MKNNENLQLNVASRLGKNPFLKEAEIVVAICGSEIIVKGKVDLFFKKNLVCKIVKEVTGIKNVVDTIEVVLSNPGQVNDADIAKAVLERFEKNFGNSHKNIIITVKNGHVILDGMLKWKFQKLLATECIGDVEGIVSIQNNISTATAPEPTVSEKDILAAIYKEESITSDITVDINGRRVTIDGHVSTSFQKKLVEKLVSDVPGVEELDSRLKIIKRSALP